MDVRMDEVKPVYPTFNFVEAGGTITNERMDNRTEINKQKNQHKTTSHINKIILLVTSYKI